MKQFIFSLALCAGLSASAQQPVRQPEVMPNARQLVRGGSQTDAISVQGLKARMDAPIQARRLAPSRVPLRAVEPMLTTFWAQDSPYNRQLPTSSSSFWGSSTYLTGCVATAMAQILNYFEYPAACQGKGSYSIDGGYNYKTVATTTTYQWDQMADRYSSGYTETQAKQVGLLMRDCGYVSNMIYTSSGSGTTAYDAGYGLAHNMQYDSLSLQVANRLYYRDQEWYDLIYSELQAGRPVLYDAVDPNINMGHAFVFDGMDAEGKVHVNWGWAGSANGYYDIEKLAPSYSDMYGQKYSYNFKDEHKMILGFKPQVTPDKDEQYKSFFAMQEKDSLWIDNDSVKLKQTPIYNFSHLNFNGLLGLVIEGEDEHGVVQPFFYSRWENNMVIPTIGGLYPAESFYPAATLNDTDGKTPRADGRYLLYLISWATPEMQGGLNPQYIRYPIKYAAPGEENFGVWEARIVNGHWDAKSVKRVKITTEETAVKGIENGELTIENCATYNLRGQRVNENSKGIVIRNGKKVLFR